MTNQTLRLCIITAFMACAVLFIEHASASSSTKTGFNSLILRHANTEQVIYYRVNGGEAHLYINREKQRGLQPGGFMAFCEISGKHHVQAIKLLQGENKTTIKLSELYKKLRRKALYIRLGNSRDEQHRNVSSAQADRDMQGRNQFVYFYSHSSFLETCQKEGNLSISEKDKNNLDSGN